MNRVTPDGIGRPAFPSETVKNPPQRCDQKPSGAFFPAWPATVVLEHCSHNREELSTDSPSRRNCFQIARLCSLEAASRFSEAIGQCGVTTPQSVTQKRQLTGRALSFQATPSYG